jgi:serine/threonine protein kinase
VIKKPIPFGKYLLLERVNVGGMAEVFVARAPGADAGVVAVKKILPTMAEDLEFITMFLDEARISVRLSHTNVVSVFDLGKVDDSFYIAMEYISGRDLRTLQERFTQRRELMPTAQAAYVISQVCEGLDYAHAAKDSKGQPLNVIHRDVSPQNVLVSYDGRVKVIDFGIAKAANRSQKTQAGILKGKFGYMSPEQVRGLPLDGRSDLFAVGVLLYEMLTGEKLFMGESDFSTLEKVRAAHVPSPRQFNPAVTPELERVMLKALARERDDRYARAGDLRDALKPFTSAGGRTYTERTLASFMQEAFAAELATERDKLDRFKRLQWPEAAETLVPAPAPSATGASPRRTATRDVAIARPVSRRVTGAIPRAVSRPQIAAVQSEPKVDLNPPITPEELAEMDQGGERTVMLSRDIDAPPTVAPGARKEPPEVSNEIERPAAPRRRTLSSASVPKPPPKQQVVVGNSSGEVEPYSGATLIGPAPSEQNAAGVSMDSQDGPALEDLPPLPRPQPPPRRQTSQQPRVAPRAVVEITSEPREEEPSVTQSAGLRVAKPSLPDSGRAKKRVFLGGGLMVLLLGVLGGAWWMLPSSGEVVITRMPLTAAVLVDGNEAMGDTLKLEPGAHALEASAEGYETLRRTFSVTKGANPPLEILLSPVAPPPAREEPPPPPEPPPAQFRVRFKGEPGARLLVDGEPRGMLPAVVEGLSPSRQHSYEVTKDGRETASGVVEGKGGETVELAVNLARTQPPPPEPKPSPIPVREQPAPKPVQKPPLERAPKPAPEKPVAEKVLPEKPRPPEPPKTVAATGTLICSSRPMGAQVWVDNRNTGRQTNIPKSNPLVLPAGTHTVLFKFEDGRASAPQTVQISEGQESRLINVEIQ